MTEQTLKEQIADTLGCPRATDGFCYCEMCQTKYWGKADSILSLIRAEVDKIENPYQLSMKTVLITRKEELETAKHMGFYEAIQAMKEMLK